MTRAELIQAITRAEIRALPVEKRAESLGSIWALEPGDAEWKLLPRELRPLFRTADSPRDASDERYVPLLAFREEGRYRGVKNEYLLQRARALGLPVDSLEGTPEPMTACLCCGYLSLEARGGHDICRVCFWQDDGQRRLDVQSHPNRMTLREARANFAAVGACSPQSVGSVLPRPGERYFRSERDEALSDTEGRTDDPFTAAVRLLEESSK